MKQYLELLEYVRTKGQLRDDRTNVGVYSVFGYQIRFDCSKYFPLLTTKRVFFKGIVHELLWFIAGSTNIRILQEHGVHIWDEWADENGELGPVYGSQWRHWQGEDQAVDQLKELVETIEVNPTSRRLILSAWNVAQLSKMALPPCHLLCQFYVHDGVLSCQLYQRSADVFLGVPFNIASYALLMHMIAHCAQLKVGDFVHTFGDVHLYANHLEQADLQLSRKPSEIRPTLKLNERVKTIFDFTPEDIQLNDYVPQAPIPASVAV